MTFAEKSLALLQKADYKVTGPRRTVLGVLEEAEIPLSPYDIQERVSATTPINVVTIYRVLAVFEKLGIAHRIHTKEGYMRCDFEGGKGCHYFAVCKKCGRSYEFLRDNCAVEKIIPKALPFKHLKHLSEIAGICDDCSLALKS